MRTWLTGKAVERWLSSPQTARKHWAEEKGEAEENVRSYTETYQITLCMHVYVCIYT